MRTGSSIRNVYAAAVLSIFVAVIGFFAQRIFINTLGIEYLGVNGLFTNIVSMLAMAELGLGSAIYYHLYKPMAVNDTAKVKSLVDFYKKGYRLVALAVFILSVLLIPFINNIVGNVNISENIYVIYQLFVLDIVFSYLLTYKRAVLYVDQNNHIISMVHMGYLALLNALQISALLITGSFYLYLIIKIVMRLVENVVLTNITNKRYTYLKDKSITVLDSATKSDIYKKIRGNSYHKVATYVVLGTDNILISVFLGIKVVGLYSNYYLVISAISLITSQIFTAITASVGNLLVNSKSGKSFEVYKRLRFGNYVLACVATTSFLVVMNSFITLWIGDKFVLPLGVLIAISINLYLTLIRSVFNSFKDAAGIFHEDRFVPVVESVVNIGFSLILLQHLGLAGVFLGTACSTLILHLFSYPKFVYKPLFKQSYRSYYSDFFKLAAIAFVTAAITYAVSRSITLEGNLATLVANVLLSVVIPGVILYTIFRKNSEFWYYLRLTKRPLKYLKTRKAGS